MKKAAAPTIVIAVVLLLSRSKPERSNQEKFLASGYSLSAGATNRTSKHSSKDFESVDTRKAKTLSWITAMRRARWIAFLRLRLNWFS